MFKWHRRLLGIEGRIVMQDRIASHIVSITKEVFGMNAQDTFLQVGQMSKFIKELDKEFAIEYKED